jgi:nucleoside 2-deoxyribosyltransferase
MTSNDLCQAIFALDRDMILEADIFFIVLDGQVPDEGACVEIGIAYSQKHLLKKDKLLIGLHTDVRGTYSNLGSKLNAMIIGSLDFIANDENELLASLAQYRNSKVRS